MRRVFIFIIASLLLLPLPSCEMWIDVDGDISIEDLEGSQTTLFYFMGRNLYSYYNGINIPDIKSAVASGALGVAGKVYYLYPTSNSTADLCEVYYEDGEAVVSEVESYTDFASISEESLSMVISRVYSDAGRPEDDPFHQMNLVVGAHGMGWELVENPSTSDPSSQMQRVSAVDYSEMGHPGVENQPIPTRYLGLSDSSTEGIMDVESVRSAIEASGVKFGYIIFDACFMSSIEVYYRLRECADYIVASPAEVLAAGFPFETALPYMFADSGTTFNLQGVCESFYNFYIDYYTESGTIAMCVTGELEALAGAVREMTIREISSSERSDLQSYEGYTTHKFYDLGDYISTVGDEDVAGLALFEEQFARAFPLECRIHTPSFYSGVGVKGFYSIDYYSGVTTGEPSLNSLCYGWELEPWAIDAGRVESVEE